MEHENANTKERNIMEVTIFLLITFGMSIFFGVVMYLNIYNNAFIIALFMMLVPATGVAFAKELKNKNKNPTHVLHYLLIGNFCLFLCMMILRILGIVSDDAINALIGLVTPLISIIVLFYTWYRCPKLDPFANVKKVVAPILIFLFISIIGLIVMSKGTDINYFNLITDIFLIIPSLISQSILFFGEEYGWREFLQPLLQKKLGKRIGVILLGIIWQSWHIPFHFPDINWNMKMLLLRFCYLIALSIFMGYIYMRSHNVWMCALVHLINNTICAYLSNNNSSDIYLGFLALSFILSLFIFSKEYDKNQNCFNNEMSPPC
ncbi:MULTISPECIES: CPBP family intramembrane glutamic endopeptidase [Clostridium]|uniref:CPBP family intramembrane glutamic endopeptidase n=1 Tax=Clostridium TaxID=1485 RepID=UPI000DF9D175|nr:CPBP family intramembrane glutamic endopeptidase [Clostridium sporogenes]STC74176.1 membrane spanning protein [Clostridium botulinum]MBA4509421.1 CPBP family intramembrane metalloprotease [Clostridium sporogenes]MCW6084498.1 CPBP family intramembrane metalloprotease [Clostridium sporogenes]MDU6334608.1 CPBP family intramembrane glutamic endopeptidase [Clostridium sporogenes]NFQ86662.1 CPBP family intramembrane metalloprotease [Clostridium sporogenes]